MPQGPLEKPGVGHGPRRPGSPRGLWPPRTLFPCTSPALQWPGAAPSGPRGLGASSPRPGPGQSRAQGSRTSAPRPQRPYQAPGTLVLASRSCAQPPGEDHSLSPWGCRDNLWPPRPAHLPAAAAVVFPADDSEGCFARGAEAAGLVWDPLRWICDNGNGVSQREPCSRDGGSQQAGVRGRLWLDGTQQPPPSSSALPWTPITGHGLRKSSPEQRLLSSCPSLPASPQLQPTPCSQPGHRDSGHGQGVSTRMTLSPASLCQHPAWQSPGAEVVVEK